MVEAFRRLREAWKALWEDFLDTPEEDVADTEGPLKGLDTVVAAGRLSEEARPYVELAYRVRQGRWRPEGVSLPGALEDATEGVLSGFDMRMRTLRQMESGDDILPESGKDLRRSAARDLVFFDELGKLSSAGEESFGVEVHRLVQSFDPRRKLVREQVDVPNAALEAIEFLLRLGAS
jgi:hypothetical protein